MKRSKRKKGAECQNDLARQLFSPQFLSRKKLVKWPLLVPLSFVRTGYLHFLFFFTSLGVLDRMMAISKLPPVWRLTSLMTVSSLPIATTIECRYFELSTAPLFGRLDPKDWTFYYYYSTRFSSLVLIFTVDLILDFYEEEEEEVDERGKI